MFAPMGGGEALSPLCGGVLWLRRLDPHRLRGLSRGRAGADWTELG